MSDWSTRAFVGHNQPEMSDKSDCENCIEYTSEDACLVKAYLYDLEKRYQQLEQVAREMLHWIEGVTWHYWTIIPEQPNHFSEQLEALGVSVDE